MNNTNSATSGFSHMSDDELQAYLIAIGVSVDIGYGDDVTEEQIIAALEICSLIPVTETIDQED